MTGLVKRIVAPMLALAGLAAAVAGGWLAAVLGIDGRAVFTASPGQSGAVIVTPQVLNRLDADFTVTATASDPAATVWLASAAPSDADLAVGATAVTHMTGLSVRDGWTVRQVSSGEGETPELARADIWNERQEGAGTQSLTVTQDTAPQSVVAVSESGSVATVSITVERRAWFVQAVIGIVAGVAVMVGAVLLWRSRLGESEEVRS